MRNWNPFERSKPRWFQKFTTYLWGIETTFYHFAINCNHIFTTYLWGIETIFIKHIWYMCRLFTTYLWGIETIKFEVSVPIFIRIYYLPMRNWNIQKQTNTIIRLGIYYLPMRNWNIKKKVGLCQSGLIIYYLPMRNWNFLWSLHLLVCSQNLLLTYEELKHRFWSWWCITQ